MYKNLRSKKASTVDQIIKLFYPPPTDICCRSIRMGVERQFSKIPIPYGFIEEYKKHPKGLSFKNKPQIFPFYYELGVNLQLLSCGDVTAMPKGSSTTSDYPKVILNRI